MCGILLHVAPSEYASEGQARLPLWWSDAARLIDARGPNIPGRTSIEKSKDGSQDIAVHASVLALRGHLAVAQPLRSCDDRLLFLWNGEVFDCTDSKFDYEANDGVQLFKAIRNFIAQHEQRDQRDTAVEEALNHTLAAIEGPYAAVLIDLVTGTLLFVRDPLGRRSLLIARHDNGIALLSAAPSNLPAEAGLEEVACGPIWRLRQGSLSSFQRHYSPFTSRKIVSSEKVAGDRDQNERDFLTVLSESVRIRVQYARRREDNAGATIAVLFSGGIDCTTIALLAHRHLPPDQPIDLLNVAFENSRSLAGGADKERTYNVPDRRTGRASLAELKSVAPRRNWRFVAVDVPFSAYTAARPEIESLMAPCASVMDLSIGAALYFASRGEGTLMEADGSLSPQNMASKYRSQAPVLLSGLGADELLGGYSRHRRAFEQGITSESETFETAEDASSSDAAKTRALVAELQLDLERLPTRNLGRDDRVLSASGREARYPFLAHGVIDYLTRLPVSAKMDLSLPPGIGDKQLLRRVAADQLGLVQTASLTKRAIQFGARSAKMDVGAGRTKGHERLANR